MFANQLPKRNRLSWDEEMKLQIRVSLFDLITVRRDH